MRGDVSGVCVGSPTAWGHIEMFGCLPNAIFGNGNGLFSKIKTLHYLFHLVSV